MNGPTRSDVHFPGVVEPIGEWEVIPCGERLAASNGQYA
jgi:hypothetical protein